MDANTPARQIDDRDGMKHRLSAALRRRTTRVRAGSDPRKVSAIAIARWLRLKPGCKHETRRRRVRELIDELRQDGCPIAADFTGYWLAIEASDHREHQEFRRTMGLKHLVAAHEDQKSPATAEAGGQLRLFAIERS